MLSKYIDVKYVFCDNNRRKFLSNICYLWKPIRIENQHFCTPFAILNLMPIGCVLRWELSHFNSCYYIYLSIFKNSNIFDCFVYFSMDCVLCNESLKNGQPTVKIREKGFKSIQDAILRRLHKY